MASRPDNTIPAGGSETGATFGAALLFFKPRKGPPLSCQGGKSHVSMPWSIRWLRDQGKRQERTPAPQAEAGGGTHWICSR